MKIGMAKSDITPRVGVELQGYGPFLCRHSDGVRDRLYARAFAVEVEGKRAVLVSCDLVGISARITSTVRELLKEGSGLSPECIMVHAIHTHSGPSIRVYSGWGAPDPPYLEILPYRIARACTQALENLQDATLSHAEVPCEGIAINRETDAFHADSAEAVMSDGWRPAKPEETDTTCHVFRIDAGGDMIGFMSYYGCHPVIGGSGSRKIHGDWPAVATNMIERLHPGSTGLFLQGAQGDINSCRVCQDEGEALRVLDVVAARYARSVLQGLESAKPLGVDVLRSALQTASFSRKPWDRDKLTSLLAEQEALLHAPDASDTENKVRMAMVLAQALRGMITALDEGQSLIPDTEVHGLRLGPVTFLGGPFEIFRAIKNEVVAESSVSIPLVLSFTNDSIGYAVDDAAAKKGGYAADTVPYICGQLPFSNVHKELFEALHALERSLA